MTFHQIQFHDVEESHILPTQSGRWSLGGFKLQAPRTSPPPKILPGPLAAAGTPRAASRVSRSMTMGRIHLVERQHLMFHTDKCLGGTV